MAVMKTAYKVAKSEGRLCTRCGWIVTKKDWKYGFRECVGCRLDGYVKKREERRLQAVRSFKKKS